MPSFGKRHNAGDCGVILQFGKQPIPFRVVERTLRVVRLVVADPQKISGRFILVVDNGHEELCCQTLSTSHDYIMALYMAQDSADLTVGLTGAAVQLAVAERWKGYR